MSAGLSEARVEASAPLVAVSGLRKRFGAQTAVAGLSFQLAAGEVLGFVGANGGGKTTSLRMLAGLLAPDAGEGAVLGQAIGARGALAREVGYMPQRLALYEVLTVRENLAFRARAFGLDQPRRAVEQALARFGLSERAKQRAGALSGGWMRRLQLAASLIHQPRLVLLDEPSAGLDMATRHLVWRHIGELARDGAGVILATHDLADAERCDRIALFVGGEVKRLAPPGEVAASVAVEVGLAPGQGGEARLRAAAGVYDVYPQSGALRVLARPGGLAALEAQGLVLTRLPVSLEDAALALTHPEYREAAHA